MKFEVTTFISVINQSIAHLMSWPIIILHFSKKFPGRNFYQNWAFSNKSGSFDDPHSSSQPTFGYNQYYTEFFLCCGEQVHNQHISLCQHFFCILHNLFQRMLPVASKTKPTKLGNMVDVLVGLTWRMATTMDEKSCSKETPCRYISLP